MKKKIMVEFMLYGYGRKICFYLCESWFKFSFFNMYCSKILVNFCCNFVCILLVNCWVEDINILLGGKDIFIFILIF